MPTAADEKPTAVCIVRQDYYPDKHVRRDAETLARTGYDVTVVSLRRLGQPRHEILNGVEVYRLPMGHRRGSVLRYVWEYAAFLLLAFLAVTMLHVKKRFRVVEVDNMPDVLVFSALIPKLTGARIVFYIFDNMPELLSVIHGLSDRHPAIRALAFLEGVSSGFADRVVVTQEVARRLVESRGVGPEKLAVVLNCPDERIFPKEPETRTQRPGRFTIVTHGAIMERSGIQVLIEALPRVIAEAPGTHLWVIGHGEYRARLEEQARARGVEGQVEFTDWVPQESIPGLLATADVGFVGMLCDLMLSNKLMDYVASQLPVVLARWPTHEHYFPDEAVKYFRSGDPDDLANAVLDVYRDREGARQRAERAYALYQEYRWAVQRERYLDIYRGLGARQDSPRSLSMASRA